MSIWDMLASTWPAQMGQTIAEALMAPGNAYKSTPDNPVTTEQMVRPAADLAGLVTSGSFAAPAMRDAAGMGIRSYYGHFGGEPPLAANDSALVRNSIGNYDSAAKEQMMGRISNNAIVNDFNGWKALAQAESPAHQVVGKDNATRAARNYSMNGQYTVLLNSDGRRQVFFNGDSISRDRIRDITKILGLDD